MEDYETVLAERRETVEARVLKAVDGAFAAADGGNVNLREVADRFNREHGADYGGARSNRWIGYILRTRLHLTTRKSLGVYTIPATEKPKIAALIARMGLYGIR